MDRRFSLILGLGLGLLGGTTGCTPSSFFSRSPSTPQNPQAPQTTQVRKEDMPSPAELAKANEKDSKLPKRKPKPATCVTYGDFRLRASMEPGRSEQEIRDLRDQARKAYQQALSLDPKCLDAHRGMAQVQSLDGDHARAITTYQGALKHHPKEALLWYEMGLTCSRAKEWEQATDAFTHAADLDPNNKKYANMVGFSLARSGKFQESLVYFTRVAGEAKARYNIARMMLHLGQTVEGKQQLELALQLEPDLKDAKNLMNEVEKGSKEIVPVQYQPE